MTCVYLVKELSVLFDTNFVKRLVSSRIEP